MTGDERRERLARARLYLCVGLRDDLEPFLDAVLGAGVDIVQLREKHAEGAEQLAAARVFRRLADAHGALFVMNDRVDIAIAAEADGVHLGQADLPPAHAREIAGPELLIGRSTHAVSDLERALEEPVDYLGVGPVHATPTKPGRAGVGIAYVREAAARARMPFFVTGGMDATTIPEARAAGARGFVVVRALTEADDPAAVARALRRLAAE